MEQVIFELLAGVVIFVAGVLIGAHNVVPVDKAISTVDSAEQSAAATLAKITAHKAVSVNTSAQVALVTAA